VLADYVSTLLWAENRSINLQIIDSWHMDSLLPQAHWQWDQAIIGSSDRPGHAPPLHDHLQRTTHAHHQHRQTIQKPRTDRKNSPWNRIGVMVPYIHHNVKP
jgi:hypothetical protein